MDEEQTTDSRLTTESIKSPCSAPKPYFKLVDKYRRPSSMTEPLKAQAEKNPSLPHSGYRSEPPVDPKQVAQTVQLHQSYFLARPPIDSQQEESQQQEMLERWRYLCNYISNTVGRHQRGGNPTMVPIRKVMPSAEKLQLIETMLFIGQELNLKPVTLLMARYLQFRSAIDTPEIFSSCIYMAMKVEEITPGRRETILRYYKLDPKCDKALDYEETILFSVDFMIQRPESYIILDIILAATKSPAALRDSAVNLLLLLLIFDPLFKREGFYLALAVAKYTFKRASRPTDLDLFKAITNYDEDLLEEELNTIIEFLYVLKLFKKRKDYKMINHLLSKVYGSPAN
jgi:hypothetical protein